MNAQKYSETENIRGNTQIQLRKEATREDVSEDQPHKEACSSQNFFNETFEIINDCQKAIKEILVVLKSDLGENSKQEEALGEEDVVFVDEEEIEDYDAYLSYISRWPNVDSIRKVEKMERKAIYPEYVDFESCSDDQKYKMIMKPQMDFRKKCKFDFLTMLNSYTACMKSRRHYCVVFYAVDRSCLVDKYGIVKSAIRYRNDFDAHGACEKICIRDGLNPAINTNLYSHLNTVLTVEKDMVVYSRDTKEEYFSKNFTVTHAILLPSSFSHELFCPTTGSIVCQKTLLDVCSSIMRGQVPECFSFNIHIERDMDCIRQMILNINMERYLSILLRMALDGVNMLFRKQLRSLIAE